MNRSICSLVMVAVVVACIVSASGQAPDKPDRFLSTLKKSQSVILKEIAGRFEISVMVGALEPQTHKIIAVETDHLVVEDIAAVAETRIPNFSIKSIVTIKPIKN